MTTPDQRDDPHPTAPAASSWEPAPLPAAPAGPVTSALPPYTGPAASAWSVYPAPSPVASPVAHPAGPQPWSPGHPAQGYGTWPVHAGVKNSLGVWSLVLGVVALVLCGYGLLFGAGAIVTGVQSRRAAQRGEATNGGLGTAGLTLGIVGCVVSVVLGVLAVIGYLVDPQQPV